MGKGRAYILLKAAVDDLEAAKDHATGIDNMELQQTIKRVQSWRDVHAAQLYNEMVGRGDVDPSNENTP